MIYITIFDSDTLKSQTKPLIHPMYIDNDFALYLTHEHTNVLLEYEKNKITEETIKQFKNSFNEVLGHGKEETT